MDLCGDRTVLYLDILIVVYTCDKIAYNYKQAHTQVFIKLMKSK